MRLDEDVYERIRADKRPDETFSEAIERLIGGPSLVELGDVVSEERAEAVERAVDAADEADEVEVDTVIKKFR